jgi:hypothetical protein
MLGLNKYKGSVVEINKMIKPETIYFIFAGRRNMGGT